MVFPKHPKVTNHQEYYRGRGNPQIYQKTPFLPSFPQHSSVPQAAIDLPSRLITGGRRNLSSESREAAEPRITNQGKGRSPESPEGNKPPPGVKGRQPDTKGAFPAALQEGGFQTGCVAQWYKYLPGTQKAMGSTLVLQ